MRRRALPLLLLLGRAWAAEPGYVDPGKCAGCHADIWRSFRETGMGRSFRKTVSPPTGAFYHRASNRHYRVEQAGAEYRLRRWQVDAAGREVNVAAARIDFVIGSGNRARTFVHRAPDGRLLQLPLSWYAERGGYWAMSPGYDQAAHLDFRREISEACLFCHNGYPAEWNGGLAEGIDCQRCHGPGDAHVRKPEKGSILNPARLTRERQVEVCLQCHLETASRGIPDSLRRAARGVFSYRPGEPLSDYKLYFDHAPASGHDDKFEINHAGYRLLQSACYQAGGMTCTTCHDPHQAARGEAAAARYRRACQGCHSGEHAARAADCASCHMPRRRTEDAVHVVMTDHRITRRPPARDLLAPLQEDHRPYRGEVVAYRAPAGNPEAPLYLAVAQVREANNLKPGIARLEAALRAVRPQPAAFYLDLAEAYRKAGDPPRSLAAAREAARREPVEATLLAVGDALLRAGRPDEAVAELEHARKLAPGAGVLLNTLGVAYGAAGRLQASLETLREAVRRAPDLPVAWVNLGVSLEQCGRGAEAEAAYREAIRLQPDFASARRHLAALLAR